MDTTSLEQIIKTLQNVLEKEMDTISLEQITKIVQNTMNYIKTHFQSIKDRTLQENQKGLPEFMKMALIKISNEAEKKILSHMETEIKEFIEEKTKRHCYVHENLEKSIQTENLWLFKNFIEKFHIENLIQILNMFDVTTFTFSKTENNHIITSVFGGKYVLSIIVNLTPSTDMEDIKKNNPIYESALLTVDKMGKIGEITCNQQYGYSPYTFNPGIINYFHIVDILNHLSRIKQIC